MVKINEVMSRYDGVARAKHLAAAGISGFHLRAALASGAVARVSRGVYATPGADPLLVAIRSLPAEPACVSAAQFGGLWVLEAPQQPHVGLTHSRTYPGFVCHRATHPPTLLDTVVQSLRCLPELDGLVIAESAVVLKGLPLASLRLRLASRSDARERRIVASIVPQSQSVIECLARFHLRRAGFHVESQVNVPGMGHLDLMVDGRLGIETDGAGFHMDRLSFEEDRRRWNVTTRLGVPTLVVTYPLLKYRPEEFIAMVREALNRLSAAAWFLPLRESCRRLNPAAA
ncbi:type IV toxin-antitoxin system AbiEi family antitoxin domain-containing protein [Arthrobacter sp. KBS0702]|uniref:type IV toxin-antitoxin system AbiEi family antitoxin domain-containing protein n=1 Tax=Arthrobacter sp. KBS0702 TaxID=2578107 RepID=UPI001643790C|nr:type IV toxin-antitoxin system AbiEi family antitoxin domain-containing protein [Arthrobacter sp. KBS0702]